MANRAKLNTITIHGRSYVLAWVGANAAHLVAEAGAEGPARPIMSHAGAEPNPAYDPGELTNASWATRTLCGRRDWIMCPTEAGRAFVSMWNGREDAVLAPSCKRCLAILDKQFAEPAPAERLGWNVIRAMEQLQEWGCVHVLGVPADQAELLRKRLRAQARQRGWKFQSTVSDGQLIAASEDALSAEQWAVVVADSMQRIQALNNGAQLGEPSWRFPWS
jgi:hypothetical protein